MNKIAKLVPLLFLAGCASYQVPPLNADHPANPKAVESSQPLPRNSLGADATTLKTKELFQEVKNVEKASKTPMQHDMGAMDQDMSGMNHGNAGGTPLPAQVEFYTCPMHPQIKQDKPGNCPICGMKLVKKGKGETP